MRQEWANSKPVLGEIAFGGLKVSSGSLAVPACECCTRSAYVRTVKRCSGLGPLWLVGGS